MSSKRPREGSGPISDGDGDGDSRKKARHGFRVGPDNLPDGPWRRKVTKIKKDLITKAKVKKQYAKFKAEFQQHHASTPALPIPADEQTTNQDVAEHHTQKEESNPSPQIHPDRQAMLESPSSSSQPPQVLLPDQTQTATENNDDDDSKKPDRQQHDNKHKNSSTSSRKRRPDYFAKDLAKADRVRAEAEARAAEKARRDQERTRRLAERELYRRRMAKAKTPGRDGKRKLGREGGLLLDRVRRLVES